MRNMFRGAGAALVVLIGALAGWHFFGRRTAAAAEAGDKARAPSVPVAATTAVQKDIPIYLDGLGTVQAYNSVTVRTQVDGQLVKIAFTEGQEVHRGDPLAQLDPQPFQAQLEQAQAKKAQDQAKIPQDRAKVRQDQAKVRQDQAKQAQDQAGLDNARLNLKRFQETLSVGGASVQNVTDQQSLIAQLAAGIQADVAAIQSDEAAVEADEAALKVDDALLQADDAAIKYAQTQLNYTTILSPMDGRTGMRLVDAGNVVHANDANGLVVVTQLAPISVVFTLPQQNLVAINTQLAKTRLPVLTVESGNDAEIERGVLELIDNQIDPATGTIRLKATFQNKERKLWPGGFVNVRLLLETRRAATVVDATAVLPGPDGSYCYLIKPDLTVEPQPVKVALIQDGQAVIDSGLQAGDRIVLSGQDRLKKGSRVKLNGPREAAPEKDEPAAPGKKHAGAAK